jgi:hypothetical protein
MKISIHQPAYLPWLGYLEKIKNSDVFIYLDTVQFSKNSFDNRNRIPDENGDDKWLTIPIKHSGKFGQTYTECAPDHYNWVVSHLDIIRQRYGKEKYFNDYFPIIKEIYKDAGNRTNLAEINFVMLIEFVKLFNIKTEIIRSSALNINSKGSSLVLDICNKFNATEYYSGIMGRDYLDFEEFKKANIKVDIQEYIPPTKWSFIHQLFINGPII